MIAAKNPDKEEIKYEISDFSVSCDGADGGKRGNLGGDHGGTGSQIKRIQEYKNFLKSSCVFIKQ